MYQRLLHAALFLLVICQPVFADDLRLSLSPGPAGDRSVLYLLPERGNFSFWISLPPPVVYWENVAENDEILPEFDRSSPLARPISLTGSILRTSLVRMYPGFWHVPVETRVAFTKLIVVAGNPPPGDGIRGPRADDERRSAEAYRCFVGSHGHQLRYRIDEPISTMKSRGFCPPYSVPFSRDHATLRDDESRLLFLSLGAAVPAAERRYSSSKDEFFEVSNSYHRSHATEQLLQLPPLQEYFVPGDTFCEYILSDQSDCDPLLTMDFRTLTDRDEIFAALSAASLASPQRFTSIEVPTSYFDRLHRNGVDPVQPFGFVVPCDQRLEDQLHRWTASNDLSERSVGVRSLDRFDPTEENERLTRAALADTGSFVVHRDQVRYRFYPVRASAVGVLGTWHLPFDLPVLEERID